MFDFCVIGGGVVGSAIFNKLTRLGKSVALIEKENDVGFGASRANTALVHSGIDCQPGTLKAKLNVRGNELFESICKRLDVPFKQTGHIIAGNDTQKLQNLLERAKQNGVKGVKILDKEKLHKLEPNISSDVEQGLFIPSGGIVASYELSVAFAEEAIVNGGKVYLEFLTKKIVKRQDAFVIESASGEKLETKHIINAAAASFNDISSLIKAETYPYILRRGEYYLLDKSEQGFVNHPIFPLPTKYSKGVIVSPTVHGNIIVGPTSIPSDASTKTTTEGLNKVKEDALKNFPSLPLRKNIRVFSGVRVVAGEDFIIKNSEKVKNLTLVAGICSPGLSACPAIAEFVAELCGLDPSNEIKNLKNRPKKIVLNELTIDEQNEIIKKYPDYGKVVCKCENISLGEIKAAVTGVLPARSVDAVKRRTRAGMGRCQSGFCIFEVMETISKYGGVAFKQIPKDGLGSQIIKTDIKQ